MNYTIIFEMNMETEFKMELKMHCRPALAEPDFPLYIYFINMR